MLARVPAKVLRWVRGMRNSIRRNLLASALLLLESEPGLDGLGEWADEARATAHEQLLMS